jgi:hypothetical protein
VITGPTCPACGADAEGADVLPEHSPGLIRIRCPGSGQSPIPGPVATELDRAKSLVIAWTRKRREAAEKAERTLAAVRGDVRGSGPRHMKAIALLRLAESQLDSARAELTRLFWAPEEPRCAP